MLSRQGRLASKNDERHGGHGAFCAFAHPTFEILLSLDVGDRLGPARLGEGKFDAVAGVQDVQQIALYLGLEFFGRAVCFSATGIGADGAALRRRLLQLNGDGAVEPVNSRDRSRHRLLG